MKRKTLYAGMAALTSPFWIPIVWAGYVSFRVYKRAAGIAFRYPERTALSLIAAGALTYGACHHGQEIRRELGQFAEQTLKAPVVQYYKKKASTLEKRLELERMRQSAPVAKAREPPHPPYARETPARTGETLETPARTGLRETPVPETRERERAMRIPRERAPAPVDTRVPARVDVRGPAPVDARVEEPDVVFYYVKPGDTLIGIARHVSGDGSNYQIIQQKNGIREPRKLMAGALLEIPRELVRRNVRTCTRRPPRNGRRIVYYEDSLHKINKHLVDQRK